MTKVIEIDRATILPAVGRAIFDQLGRPFVMVDPEIVGHLRRMSVGDPDHLLYGVMVSQSQVLLIEAD